MGHVKQLLAKTDAGKKKVRLLGISVSNLHDPETRVGDDGQLLLPFKFDRNDADKPLF
jgi:hypothetical protein